MLTLAAAAILLSPQIGLGASTRSIQDGSFEDLQKGEFEGVALSSDGFLIPSYSRRSVGDTGAEIVWSVLPDGPDRFLCATGHDGKLVRLDGDGEAEVVADLPESELTAMVRLGDGSVIIAAAPSGVLYRLGDGDELTTYTMLDAKFVWDLEVDEEDNVWAATGTDGKLYKISPGASGPTAEVAADFPSQNIIDLWLDREGTMGDAGLLYVAGQSPAWLYRYRDGDSEPEVVFNAESDEIRAIAPTAEGLAIATNTERAPSPRVLSLTLRMSGAAAPRVAPASGSSSASSTPTTPSSAGDMGDVFKAATKKPPKASSKIMLLTPEGFARELWESPERPIHSIAASAEGRLLVAAGGRGRLFELGENKTFSLITDVQEDYLVKIVPIEGGWLLGAARNGMVFSVDNERAEQAIYRSRIIDASTPALWGGFSWYGQISRGQSVSVAFRKGATDDPEKGNWEEWSKDQKLELGESTPIPDGPARYMQYRLTLEQGRSDSPLLKSDYATVFYRRPNRPPRVTKVTVAEGSPARSGSSGSSSGSNGSSASRARSSTSSSSSRSGSGSSSSAKSRSAARAPHSNTHNLNLTWKATDPNGDSLVYAVYFKADDETQWKLIEDELKTTRMPLNVSGVGDGRYRFKVIATDRFSNLPGAGFDAELVSESVIVDNTPPKLENLRVRVSGRRASIRFKAVDEHSRIASIKIDFDNGDSFPIFPADGFFDQRTEDVDWMGFELEPGEHVVTIAVTDQRGNTEVRRDVFNIRP